MQLVESVDYQTRVMLAAIQAVALVSGGGTGRGAIIDPGASEGLCDAIAAILVQTGAARTRRDRKVRANGCRERILLAMQVFDDHKAMGTPLPWVSTLHRPAN